MLGSIDIRVRYAECDPMGVAHHTAYPVWFEMGRTELLRSTGLNYRNLENDGYLLAVVTLIIQYKNPAKYDDLLRLETKLENISRVRIDHSYRLLRDGVILATAETTLACLDRTGRAQALPQQLIEASQ